MILSHLILNEDYSRKVFPFLKEEYFQSQPEVVLFQLISAYTKAYSSFPSKEALFVDLSQKREGLNETSFKETYELIRGLERDEKTELSWLIDQTEKFCQDRAIYNAIRAAIGIQGDPKGNKGAIPKLLSDALAVSFDTHIGLDFLEDWEARYDLYHVDVGQRITFPLDSFNKMTKGGLIRKTFNCILAPTGVGKTMFMTAFASHNLMAGHNVLYITLEMAEERIAERIDANLMDFTMDDLPNVPKELYKSRIESLSRKTQGKLIIKEYPTTQAGAAHFRYLINDLKLKKNFVPDILYVDYINICSSTRKDGYRDGDSYGRVKAIAEELRGLAVEFNIPLVTATQTNRGGFKNSNIDMDNTSDSWGLPMTADLFFAVITSEELAALNQIAVKQLKSRYDDVNKMRTFSIGVDKSKMRLYDVERTAQANLIGGDVAVFDNGDFMAGDRELFAGFR